MNTSSIVYQYTNALPNDTRDPVKIDVDFNPVFPGPDSRVRLLYLGISGMRQNQAGNMAGSGDFSARLIGNLGSINTPIYTVAVPRPGDSIAQFDGIAFSSSNPLYISSFDPTLELPRTFQIEFLPSNTKGATPNDTLTMYVTIGFIIL